MQLRIAIWISALVALVGLLFYMLLEVSRVEPEHYFVELVIYAQVIALGMFVLAGAYLVDRLLQALGDND